MTPKRLYETAETLVYDPVAANRNATRASLHSLGFRNVDGAASLDLLADRLRSRSLDLLIAEVAGSEAETCALVQAVRQGTLGENPFVIVIMTTWRRDGTIVAQVLNSGADDLVARPVSTANLGERVRLLSERRKGFVVTSDYIGPDRRRDPRSGGNECLEVPNPLKFKANDSLSDDDAARCLAEAVQSGKEKINLEKLRRDSVQLCLQWKMLDQRTPDARDFSEILRRIESIAAEMLRRAVAANQEGVVEWCESLAESSKSIGQLMELAKRGGAPGDYKAPLRLLGHAAMALGQLFAPGETAPAQLVELDRIVSRKNNSAAA
jgi:DNA-binding response OmpR family regulator